MLNLSLKIIKNCFEKHGNSKNNDGYESLVITEKTIDVRKLIHDRNPKLAKWIPRFLLRFLERLIHQKEINETLYRNKDKQGLDAVEAFLNDFGVNVKTHNIENIKDENRFLLVSNHPLGGVDGLALMKSVGRVKPPICFPVNDFLLYLPNISELFIPINKIGSQSTANARKFDEAFLSEKNILFFPAGLASRKIKGKIVDTEWKKTFVQKARNYQRNVIPVFIDGRNSNRFYRLAKWRKFFGIKFNIEMLFLPDETFKQKGKTLNIYFGKPIPYTQFDNSKKDIEWAKYVKEIVYSLKQNL